LLRQPQPQDLIEGNDMSQSRYARISFMGASASELQYMYSSQKVLSEDDDYVRFPDISSKHITNNKSVQLTVSNRKNISNPAEVKGEDIARTDLYIVSYDARDENSYQEACRYIEFKKPKSSKSTKFLLLALTKGGEDVDDACRKAEKEDILFHTVGDLYQNDTLNSLNQAIDKGVDAVLTERSRVLVSSVASYRSPPPQTSCLPSLLSSCWQDHPYLTRITIPTVLGAVMPLCIYAFDKDTSAFFGKIGLDGTLGIGIGTGFALGILAAVKKYCSDQCVSNQERHQSQYGYY
jgi:hypothetical protein